jgi:hypothetical protein
MEQFAKQSYYDEIIVAIVALGFRLVAQVTITMDDMPYFIPTQAARNTCLTFDIPGKAIFAHFYHNEDVGKFENGYSNHWSIRVETNYVEEVEYTARDRLAVVNINGLQSGWTYRHQDHFTFTGDITDGNLEILTPVEAVVKVATQLQNENIKLLAEKFPELCMSWAPTYTFTGEQTSDYDARKKLEDKLDNIFWERFGKAGNVIIREKVLRIY